MNHEYQANPNNGDKCIDCGYPASKHGPNALCDSCNNTGDLNPFGLGNTQALLCRDCIEKEKAILVEAVKYQTPELQQQRLDEYKRIVTPYEQLIADARKIDEQVHLSTDIFNAKTVAYIDIRDAVMANPDIPKDQKVFELARICKERISHFSKVIFDLDKKKIEAYSEQKNWHVQLNGLANQLRIEEREQLKISDIHYDVKMPKSVTPHKIKTSPKKATKDELRVLANELKLPEYTIQLLMTSKNWTIEQVGNHLRKTIKEGQSMLPSATDKPNGESNE